MGMRLNRLRQGTDPAVVADIDSSLESLDRVVRQIRATIRALRDPDDVTGLVDRLNGEANRAHISLGFHPTLSLHPVVGLDELVPPEVADDVVAVVREGLSNAARHARASSVRVDVRADDERILVEVIDNGVGMPDSFDRRSGVDNLAERARRHDGSSSFRANPAGGTALTWQARLSS